MKSKINQSVRFMFLVASSSTLMFFASCSKGDSLAGIDDSVRTETELKSSTSSKGTGTIISYSALPQAAKDYLQVNYLSKGWTVKKVESQIEDTGLVYKVTLVSGKTTIKVLFNAQGSFIGTK